MEPLCEPPGILIFSQADLAQVAAFNARLLADVEELRPLVGQVWRAACAALQGNAPRQRPHPPLFLSAGRDAFQIVGGAAAASADQPAMSRTHWPAAAGVNIAQQGAVSLGPLSKMQKVSENAGKIGQIRRFAEIVAEVNISRNSNASKQSSTSGVPRWVLVCDLTQRPHFPPTEEAAPDWPSLLEPRRTFSVYAAHPGTSCHLIGIGAARRAKVVTPVPRGLLEAGYKSSPAGPAISKNQL